METEENLSDIVGVRECSASTNIEQDKHTHARTQVQWQSTAHYLTVCQGVDQLHSKCPLRRRYSTIHTYVCIYIMYIRK